MNAKENVKTEWIKWAVGAVAVPIIVSIVASGIFFRKSTAVVYREVPLIEKFNVLEYYPLKEGNYWIYSRKTRYQGVDTGTKVIEENRTLKVSVKKIQKYDDYILVTMEGYPFLRGPIDLKHKYGYLIISNKVYYVPSEKLDKIQYANNLDLNAPSEEFFQDIVLEFEFPLFDGQKIGDLTSLIRKDLNYFDNVKKEDSYQIRINDKLEKIPVYKISFSSNPSDTEISFIPYVGITSYSYVHHGTVDEVELELLETNAKD